MSQSTQKPDRAPITTGSTPALHRKWGDYVSPDEAEQNQDYLDRAEAYGRSRVINNDRLTE